MRSPKISTQAPLRVFLVVRVAFTAAKAAAANEPDWPAAGSDWGTSSRRSVPDAHICGAHDAHQPAAFTCLPLKIWQPPWDAPSLPV